MGLGQCECAHPSVWAAAGLRTLCAGRFHSDFLDFLDFLDPDPDPAPDCVESHRGVRHCGKLAPGQTCC